MAPPHPLSPSPFCNRHWTTLGGQPRLLQCIQTGARHRLDLLLLALSESPAIRQLPAVNPSPPLRPPSIPSFPPPPSFARDKSQPGPPGPRLVLVVDRLIHL